MSASDLQRRDFLKLVGIGVAGTAAGCGQLPGTTLIPYLVGPNDTLPGIPEHYASTCRECAAGCGIVVKAREGRAIKIEGNPAHPVNAGALCARGQASLQGLYDPDRIKAPQVREGNGWKAITWDEALQLAGARLAAARGSGAIALLTDHQPGTFGRFAGAWAAEMGGRHLAWEPFDYASVREANRLTFGIPSVPRYDLERAEMIVSFGADFLETFLTPTPQSRAFARARAQDRATRFVAVEPRLSMTGSNADEWLAVRPGSEMAVALAMVNVIVTEGLARNGAGLAGTVAAFTPEAAASQSGVPAERIIELARAFSEARPSVALAGGIAAQSEQAVATVAAVNLLNWVAGNVGETVRFDGALDFAGVAGFGELQRLIADMTSGAIQVLLVHGANPTYALPGWAGFAQAMAKVPFKIAIATALDDTAAGCDLVLPASHFLESWGDLESAPGVRSLQQPAMVRLPLFDSRPAGETLIALGKAAGAGAAWPGTWLEQVRKDWGAIGSDEAAWSNALRQGGVFQPAGGAASAAWRGGDINFVAPTLRGEGDLALVVYPSPNFGDGRGANKPWLQELPDPVTKGVWGSWAELHPDTCRRLGVKQGDAVTVQTDAGRVEVPVYAYSGVRPDVVAIALGQGHAAYGRYAQNRGVNALALLPAAQDVMSGAPAYLCANARVTRAARAPELVVSQREKNQHGRGIAQIVPLAALSGRAAHGATTAPADSAHGAAPDTAAAPGTPGPAAHAEAGGAAGHAEAAAGGPHHVVLPNFGLPGRNTEPMARPADHKLPAHAVSAAELHEQGRSPRRNPVTEGNYGTAKHRWAMAIDINACTGCSACVVACYAENNVPVVGPELVKRGREMSWIRIERWEEKVGGEGTANDVRNVPMLCQHCSDAPCEIVCPVYATYHNPEGLNAQVYNRCVGTRYCSNNCPYKVRTFNFFDYSAPEKPTFAFPEPLNWQLNPDVTVRSKGVMEKCTFCVQRILEVKGNVRDEGRELRDGDITPACAQSCPTQAIVFGDLLDPNSRVNQLSYGNERRYWVLNELNTKPAITYLKKIARET